MFFDVQQINVPSPSINRIYASIITQPTTQLWKQGIPQSPQIDHSFILNIFYDIVTSCLHIAWRLCLQVLIIMVGSMGLCNLLRHFICLQ
jgi:hypothetical protein